MSRVAVAFAMAVTLSIAWRLRPSPMRVLDLMEQHEGKRSPSPQLRARWVGRAQRRHSRLVARNYPDFIDVLVLTVRAGCTPLEAFDILSTSVLAPIGDALGEVVLLVARGARFADALAELPTQIGSIAQPLADSLALSDRYGTPLAPILDRLGEQARAQRRRNADIAARQLPVRLSFPLVGCTLPSFVLLTIVPLLAGTFSSLQGLRR